MVIPRDDWWRNVIRIKKQVKQVLWVKTGEMVSITANNLCLSYREIFLYPLYSNICPIIFNTVI